MLFDLFRRPKGGGDDHAPGRGTDPRAGDAPNQGASVDGSGYLSYATHLDAQQRVKGYRLSWIGVANNGTGAGAILQLKNLVGFVIKHLKPEKRGWRLGGMILYFDVPAEGLFLPELQALPPEKVVLCLSLEDLMDADTRSMLLFLREQGFGFMLRDALALPADPELQEILTHVEVDARDPALIDRLRGQQSADCPPVQMIASRLTSWADFDACALRHVDAFVDGEQVAPPVGEPGELKPESMLIVRLMQMIQRNEDVRPIEAALKRDAALTFRLLSHINSPAIGAGVEVHSLRHAVSMLGYTPLFRWLSLLLATSNRASSPFMMKKAIMRGRFVELMGQGMLPASESDNLFVVGMFSLIDQLLGVSMEEVLDKVQLGESVQQAILAREGVYGPFLALAEACERGASEAAHLSESLFMDAARVNTAHLLAMAWAQDVSVSEPAR